MAELIVPPGYYWYAEEDHDNTAPNEPQRWRVLEYRRGDDTADDAVVLVADDLLAALERCLEVIHDIASEQCDDGENVYYWNREDGYGFQTVNRARAAIQKARGEAP